MADWRARGVRLVMVLAAGLSMPVLLAQKPLIPGPPPRQIQGWSNWRQTLVEKRDPLSGQSRFTWDDRFEYRWKPEWTASGYTCAVEVRPAGDEDESYQLSVVDVLYRSPDHAYFAADSPLIPRKAQLHDFTTSTVKVRNRTGHAAITAGDCGSVVAVAAGRFSPQIPIPLQVSPLQ